MLSRVANSLYWMVRYIERADNLSRLIDVNEQLLLDHERLDNERREVFWRPILLSTGDDGLFEELYGGPDPVAVVRFLTSDRRNPNSIVSCIGQARENARMVRDQLSEELWEELNALYLFLQSPQSESLMLADPPRYYEMIRRATYTFHGIAAASTARSESWEFMDLGRHLERADKTTRFLDVTHFLPEPEVPGAFQGLAILRSCGALGAFRAEHGGAMDLDKVVDFLLFSPEFPRSVRFCAERIDRSLHRISGSPRGTYVNAAERMSGKVLAAMSYGSTAEVLERGLHEALDELQEEFNAIGEEVFKAYVLLPDQEMQRPPIPASSVSAVVAWQMAQQQQ